MRQRQLPTGEVTLMFTDIQGSTKLLHDLGDVYGDVLSEHHRLLRDVWVAHNGVEVNTEGDAFFVAFWRARSAVQAAADAQAALAAHPWPHGRPVAVRIGVHTGTPQIRDDDYWGHDVHYAARVGSAAHGGQVLISASTQTLVPDVAVDDLGEHALKDFPAPRRLYHLNLGGRTSADYPAPKTLSVTRTNLPTVTGRLVGRAAEVAEVRELLTADVRLLTLTGVGGSGKSRLVIACGTDLLDAFDDGVFLVALSAVGSEAAVPRAIADALGVSIDEDEDPVAALGAHLRGRELLLVVDNLEHVLGTGLLLCELLERAPGLRILATSQAPLRVRPETVMPLAPLGVQPAMALFADRARATDAGFRLEPEDMQVVAEICRRLDGLPLGIELAAARVRMGGPARVLEALDRGIDALGAGARDLPERQRGLRAALNWTVGLLGENDQLLVASLGTFAEAWTIELADQMFGNELDVWEGTATLLDFSLIRTRGDGRFAMAQTARAFAQTLLFEQERDEICRRRHAEVLAAEAQDIVDTILFDVNSGTARTIDLTKEFDAALDWAKVHDRPLHLRLLGTLGFAYYWTGHLPHIAAQLKDDTLTETSDAIALAHLHIGRSLVVDDGRRRMEETGAAVAIRRTMGDEFQLALALVTHGLLASFADPAHGLETVEEALRLPYAQSDRRLQLVLEGVRVANLVVARRLDEAEAKIIEIFEAGDRASFGTDLAIGSWADCALEREQYCTALERYVQSLRLIPRETQTHNALFQCYGIACSLIGLGREAEAIEMMAAIEAAVERGDIAMIPEDTAPGQAARFATARKRLGAKLAAEARARGRRRDVEDVIAWALELSVPRLDSAESKL